MATQTSQNTSDVWHLDTTQAELCTPQLTAKIDLLNPHLGLGQLVYNGASIPDFVLGVTPNAGNPLKQPGEAPADLSDVFVRGNDLVATYAETKQRPFSLQVYWRATVGEQGTVLLDAILSLQTDLLESFPGLAVQTKLSAETAWLVAGADSQATEIDATEINVEQGQQHKFLSGQSDGLLLRSSQHGWSYAEMTHPEDRGESEMTRLDPSPSQGATYQLQRQLGGQFLEKGVIRRLRVRGVFLPRENDLELAVPSLASLATEQPPLTV